MLIFASVFAIVPLGTVFAADNEVIDALSYDTDGDGLIDTALVRVDNPSKNTAAIYNTDGWAVEDVDFGNPFNNRTATINNVTFGSDPAAEILIFEIDFSFDAPSEDLPGGGAGISNYFVRYRQQNPIDVLIGTSYDTATNTELAEINEPLVRDEAAVPPRITNFNNEGVTFNVAGDQTMQLTFSETLTVAPTVDVALAGVAGVTSFATADCDAAAHLIYCFTYPVPNNSSGTATLHVTGAADADGNVMFPDDGRQFSFDTTVVQGFSSVSEPPFVVSASSDGATYNAAGVQNILVTFNESLQNLPVITVDGGEAVTICNDANAATFCFDYNVPAQTSTEKTISISGGMNLGGTIMAPDATHKFRVETVQNAGGGGGGGGGGFVVRPQAPEEEVTLLSEDEITPFDDIDNHWARPFIEELQQMGIVEGKLPGKFEPNSGMTRAEVTKVALLMFGYDIPEGPFNGKPFVDIDMNAWYAPYIVAGKEAGVIRGYGPDFRIFKPNQIVSRAEILQIFLEAAKLPTDGGKLSDLHFKDIIYAEAWYIDYIVYALKHQVIEGFADGTYRPDQFVTRGEMAKILVKTSELAPENVDNTYQVPAIQ